MDGQTDKWMGRQTIGWTDRQMDICDCRVAFTTDKYSNNILIMSNTFTFSNVLVVEIIFSNCCWVKKTRGINNDDLF